MTSNEQRRKRARQIRGQVPGQARMDVPRHFGASVGVAVTVIMALGLSACAGNTGSTGTSASNGGGSSQGDTLNIGLPNLSGRTSLDPAKSLNTQTMIAYDTLVTYGPDGSYSPGLASKFGYTVPGKVFDMTLRPNVKFSDGTTMTAEGVKQSFEYMAKNTVNPAYFAGKSMTVTGPMSVRITAATADPTLPALLSSQNQTGYVISPKALANPSALATSTDGAGQYMLDAKATVTGSTYTYVANPNYWDPTAVHYKKLVLKVIANPTTLLNAAKSGEVDVALADPVTGAAAESAGLNVQKSPTLFVGLLLLDRDGKLSKPLADVRIRQAINYALDRETLTSALFGKFGTPTDQTVNVGQDGRIDKVLYPYDPAKAKALLTAAGYPNGFELPVVTTAARSRNIYTEAISGELAKVGITLKIDNKNPDTLFYNDLWGGKYPAASMYFGAGPMFFEGQFMFLPTAQFNPFHTSDETLLSLYSKAAAANDADRKVLDQQMEQRLMDLAWVAPISFIDGVIYARKSIAGIELTPGNGSSNPVWWKPAAS